MKPKYGMLGAGIFFVLVVAGIAFLLMQGEKEIPERTVQNDVGDSDGVVSTEVADPAISHDTSVGSGSVPAQVESALNVAPAQDAPGANTPRPSGPGVLTGVVTWIDGGEPASGAQIVVHYWDRLLGLAPTRADRFEWTSKTDAQGRYRLEDLPAPPSDPSEYAPVVVTAYKDGASAVGVSVLDDDNPEANIDLALRPSGVISGQVLDVDGEPIQGAIVRPHAVEGAELMEELYPHTYLWSNTDEEGRFHVEHVVEGEWRLSASSEHFAQAISPPFQTGESNATIVMTRGAYVSGNVVDTGRGDPVSNIALFVIGEESYQALRRVESDNVGAFRADALPDGDYRIYTEDKTRVIAGAPPRVTIANARPVEGVKVEVAEGGSISGTVRDAVTGAPIPGVRVKVWFDEDVIGPRLEAPTDASGAYRIIGLAAGQCTVYRIEEAGYVSGDQDSKTVSLALGQALEGVDFTLSQGVHISGTVVDETGKPVAGVKVATDHLGNQQAADATREDGAFTVPGLERNSSVTLNVSGRDYAALQTPALNTGDKGITGVQIVVTQGGSISGIVVKANGGPAPDTLVLALRQDDLSSYQHAITGPKGAFELRSLAPGAYLVQANSSATRNSEEASTEVTLAKGETVTGIQLVLGDATDSIISGRITNAKGEPLADASVNANSFTSESNAFAESDAKGNYELPVESGLVYRLDVYHHDYSNQERDGVVAGSSKVDFTLEGYGSVEGQVVDAASGKPVPSFEVSHTAGLSNPGDYQSDDYVSYFDEAGRFQIDDVDAGEATLFVRAAGYGPASLQVAEVRPGEVSRGLRFQLQPGASIAGLVRDTQGTPIQNAQIYAGSGMELWLINMGAHEAIAVSDAQGQFTISSLGEDLTAISAVHPDFSKTSVELSLQPGQTQQIEIVMAAGGTVEGIVTANGAPSAYQDVFVHSELLDDFQTATTDANGHYSVANIAPGEVDVSANVTLGDATRSENKTALVEAGATTTLNFNVEFGTGAIEGTLFDGGVPVNEGYISALRTNAAEGLAENIDGTVKPGGAYRISGLDAGPYKVMVNVGVFGENGEKSRTVDVTVAEGETVFLDIDLGGGAQVHGIVSGISDTGMCMVIAFKGTHQIADMESAMAPPEMQNNMAGSSSVGATGDYTISGLEAGDYTVVAIQIDPAAAQGPVDAASIATGHVTVGESGATDLDLAFP